MALICWVVPFGRAVLRQVVPLPAVADCGQGKGSARAIGTRAAAKRHLRECE